MAAVRADELGPLLGDSADPSAARAGSFEDRRRRTGFVLGPALFGVVALLPLGLTTEQQLLAAVLALVVTYWLTEAIPVPATALLGLALCAFLGVAPPAQVLAGFASPTIFLFIGSFMLARAMSVHGLDRRFALRILSVPRIAGSTYGTLLAFGLVAAALSAFISNTAATAMLLPIGIGIVGIYAGLIHDESPDHGPGTARLGAALMLMIAYSASVGGLLTPIGSPPNLLGRGFLEEQAGLSLPFLRWMLVAAPIVLVSLGLLFVLLIALNRPEARRIPGATAYIASQRRLLGRLSAGERNALLCFLLAVGLWLAPGLAGLLLGEQSTAYAWLSARLDEGVVALLAGVPAVRAARASRPPCLHAQLAPGGDDRLGHDHALRGGYCARFAALLDGPGAAHRPGPGGLRGQYHPVSPDLAGRAGGDLHLRDDQQYGQRGHRRAHRHQPGQCGRHRSGRAGPGRRLRRLVRVHAARLDAAQRHRLRLGHGTHHAHDPVRAGVRPAGRALVITIGVTVWAGVVGLR
ncbi:MAG TPA: SLC13 family permease [Candidatus Limnocylindria bacterium]|nr:SLC13 family permease [Candidatus Limnocylindria bacterium]